NATAARLTPFSAAALLAIATTVLSLVASSWTASGPDSYAYLSHAAMLREGRLSHSIDLVDEAPWPGAAATFVPFGYRATDAHPPALVPVTAPGLPMLMAALQRVAGHCAAFVVTPLAGGALVFLTFLIGRRVKSPAAGLIAAWLVATSPAVLFMLMWPMSDIPAAAWTAAMVRLLLSASAGAAFGAGLAASAGILTRSTVAAIAAAAGLWLIIDLVRTRRESHRWRRAIAFAVALLPGVALTAWLNDLWHGSPWTSGYGATGELFSTARIGTNAAHYLTWLAETSPLGLVGLAALAWPSRRIWSASGLLGRPNPAIASVPLLFVLVVAAAAGVYLTYFSYEQWWYLRFLLPAWPAMFVATAVVADAVRLRGRVAAIATVAIVVIAGLAGVRTASARGVFNIGAEERRYVGVARLVDSATEPEAVILTSQHAGTIRYYAGRETLRFDVLDPAWLDRAVTWLASRGRPPYILIEDWELPSFSARFGGSSALGDLSFTPAVAWQSTRVRGWVFLYDPLRRNRKTARPGPELEQDQPRCAAPAHTLLKKPAT
ncbi:MAG: ArnT family glycosyltransferase, partial [Acidobacteriota bacterium]